MSTETFSILDYLKKLEPAREGRYICPVCGGHNLTINKRSAAYKCWNGCECRDIREAIAPWQEKKTTSSWHKPSKPKKQIEPAPLPEQINLAKLPQEATDSPQPKKRFSNRYGEVQEWAYQYTADKWKVRTQWTDATKPKGYEKDFLLWHQDVNGKPIAKAGEGVRPPYRINEAIAAAKASGANAVMGAEGEESVESYRRIGLACITLSGFGNGELELMTQLLKDAELGLIYHPDHDKTGRDKAAKIQEACDHASVFRIVLDPVTIYPDLPESGDIVQILVAMDTPEFIQRLEEEIHRAIEQRQHSEPASDINEKTVEIDLDERLKLDLQELLGTDDPIKRMRRRAEIASYYRLSKVEIDEALKELRQRNVTPEPTFFSLADFLSQSEEPLEYIVPSLLPVGETVLLVAPPKCGKSLLATDLIFAVATNEDTFLGEQCKQGRVLLVSVDESPSSTRSKLLKRGFRAADDEWLQVMTRFDISQMSALEERLESFRPSLVVIDSLRRINHGRQISENSSEYADTIYSLKELLHKYGAAGVLIHHSSKDREATGVNKVRGSSAISGAVWGVWQLEHLLKEVGQGKAKKQVFDPKDPNRIFTAILRDAEGQCLKIELDPESNHWVNHGGEGDDGTAADMPSMRQRVRNLLERNRHRDGLMVSEIRELLGLEPGDRSIYTILNRMADKREIWVHPSNSDRRRMVYSLPKTEGDSLPPSMSPTDVEQSPGTHTQQRFQDTQQIVNTPPKISQHLGVDKQVLTNSNLDAARNAEVSQHPEPNRGGEGVDESAIALSATTSIEKSGFKVGDKLYVRVLPKTEFGTPHPCAGLEDEAAVIEMGGKLAIHLEMGLIADFDEVELLSMPQATEPLKFPNQQPSSIAVAPTKAPVEFKVGDRVHWEECPGYCNWANPFTITCIENAKARLDIYAQPVPLTELRLVEQ